MDNNIEEIYKQYEGKLNVNNDLEPLKYYDYPDLIDPNRPKMSKEDFDSFMNYLTELRKKYNNEKA